MMAQVQYQTFSDSQLLADMAVEALIDEVNLTPKPALVDRRGSGAHDDLTLELMERSAKSLGPMFEAMAQAAKHHGKVCLALREDIGEIGRQGEKVMMLATDGVNTHRGAIWALGLMVTAAALARTNQQYLSAVELCQLAGQIAQRRSFYSKAGFESWSASTKEIRHLRCQRTGTTRLSNHRKFWLKTTLSKS